MVKEDDLLNVEIDSEMAMAKPLSRKFDPRPEDDRRVAPLAWGAFVRRRGAQARWPLARARSNCRMTTTMICESTR